MTKDDRLILTLTRDEALAILKILITAADGVGLLANERFLISDLRKRVEQETSAEGLTTP